MQTSRLAWLAPPEQPHHEAEHNAQEQTGHQREIKRGVVAANDNVAREASQANGQPLTESQQEPKQHQHDADGDEGAAHALIINPGVAAAGP